MDDKLKIVIRMPRTQSRSNQLARRVLDSRLAELRALPHPPPRGWIRAIREALGMSAADLGRRMGLSRQAVLQMERSEADGSIRLETLRRAAEALDATLSYALVPNASLDEQVDRRAREVAEREVDAVEQTMLLEDQLGGADERDELVARLAETVRSSAGFWRD
jgi:predicted DNA-binding mobile mystery protein A